MFEIWELTSKTGKPDSETQPVPPENRLGPELRNPTRAKRGINRNDM